MPARRKDPTVSLDSYSNSVAQEKSYFTFVAGLNTDASPLAFPDNFSSDEENFVLDIDGSRRRRKGLELEYGGQDVTGLTATSGVVRAHHWRNVNGDPTLNFLVMQNGRYLHFFTDSPIVTSNEMAGALDLVTFVAGSATYTDIQASPVNMDYGRGHLFVVGKFIKPFWVKYDTTTDTFVATEIAIRERDFEGIEDGVDITTTPDTLTSAHAYNLQNRGWPSSKITDFENELDYYPSKNMIPWFGQQEIVDESTSSAVEKSGVKQFSNAKLVSELWQDVSAPVGHFLKSIYDTPSVTGGAGDSFAISTITFSGSGPGSVTMKVRVDSDHTIADNDSIAIEGVVITYRVDPPGGSKPIKLEVTWSPDGPYIADVTNRSITAATNVNPAVFTSNGHGLVAGDRVTLALTGGTWNTKDGTYTIASVTTNTFTITSIDGTSLGTFTSGTATPKNFFEETVTIPQFAYGYTLTNPGTVWTAYTSTGATTAPYRPTAVAWYAGRVWYAGIPNQKNSHKVYYTQVVENDSQYNRCYQVADPTSEHISDLIDTDGGTLIIPEIDNVYEVLAYNGRLLVFASNGVWEVAGGERGYFTATGYSIRQLSSNGTTGPFSVIIADGTPYYLGDGAIYSIQQDPNLGFLFSKDITTGRIQKLLNSLSKDAKGQVQTAYDKNAQKIYWLYNSVSNTTWKYDTWLVLDLRLNAFSKFTYKGSGYDVRSLYDIEDYQQSSLDYKNIKFIALNTARTTIRFSEQNEESFEDFGTDAAAFLETGSDGLGDISRRRYGRYLFVYMERTEDENSNNLSECLIKYVWNWADSATSGAWNVARSVYRRYMRKYRNPLVNAGSVMGELVMTSRTKIRGSGHVLRLRFDTEAGKDCHIYGWQLRQDFNAEA